MQHQSFQMDFCNSHQLVNSYNIISSIYSSNNQTVDGQQLLSIDWI